MSFRWQTSICSRSVAEKRSWNRAAWTRSVPASPHGAHKVKKIFQKSRKRREAAGHGLIGGGAPGARTLNLQIKSALDHLDTVTLRAPFCRLIPPCRNRSVTAWRSIPWCAVYKRAISEQPSRQLYEQRPCHREMPITARSGSYLRPCSAWHGTARAEYELLFGRAERAMSTCLPVQERDARSAVREHSFVLREDLGPLHRVGFIRRRRNRRRVLIGASTR